MKKKRRSSKWYCIRQYSRLNNRIIHNRQRDSKKKELRKKYSVDKARENHRVHRILLGNHRLNKNPFRRKKMIQGHLLLMLCLKGKEKDLTRTVSRNKKAMTMTTSCKMLSMTMNIHTTSSLWLTAI